VTIPKERVKKKNTLMNRRWTISSNGTPASIRGYATLKSHIAKKTAVMDKKINSKIMIMFFSINYSPKIK
jgi:hypothetical protein